MTELPQPVLSSHRWKHTQDERAQPSMAALTLEGAVITVSLSTPRDGRCEKSGASAHSRLCLLCEGGVGRLQQQPGRNWEETKPGQLKLNNKSVIRASGALLSPDQQRNALNQVGNVCSSNMSLPWLKGNREKTLGIAEFGVWCILIRLRRFV